MRGPAAVSMIHPGGRRWRRFLALAGKELRLWLRSGGFWLALAAMHFWGLPWRWLVTPILTSQDVSWQLLRDGLSFGGLIVLFASAAAMGRDRGSQDREWVDSLPVSNAEWVTARWLGGLLAWGLAGLELFLVATLFQAAQGDAPVQAAILATFYGGHFLPGVSLLHTLGTLLGALPLSSLLTYGLVPVLWALTAMPTSPVTSYLPAAAAALPAGVPPRGIFLQPSAVSGLYPYEPLNFWRRFVQLDLAVLGLVLAALTYHPRREAGTAGLPRRRWMLAGAAGLLLLAAGLAGRAYLDWQQVIGPGFRNVPQPAQAQAAGGQQGAPAADRAPVVAEHLTLQVQLEEGRSRYRAQADVLVRNVGAAPLRSIPVHLGPTCVVEGAAPRATSPDPVRPLAGSRTELIPPAPLAPGETFGGQIRYTCHYRPDRPWRLTRGAPPVLEHLSYPDFPAPPGGTRWDVTVTMPAGFWLISNVPSVAEGVEAGGRRQIQLAGKAGELRVFGASYSRREHGPLQGYAHPYHARALDPLLAAIAQRIDHHRRWLGRPRWHPDLTPRPVVVEVPEPFVVSGVLGVREHELLRFAPAARGTGDPGRQRLADSLALALWWGGNDLLGAGPLAEPVRVVTGPGGRSRVVFTSVELGTVQFLNVRFHMVQAQDPHSIRATALAVVGETVEGTRPSGPFPDVRERDRLGLDVADPVAAAVFLTLDEVATRLGEAAARRVVGAVHDHFVEAGLAALRAVREPAGPETEPRPSLGAELQGRIDRFLQAVEALPGAEVIAARARERLAQTVAPGWRDAGEGRR